jgi:PmbA protein
VKVHSNGFEGEQEDSSFVIFAMVTVKDEQGTRPEDYAFAVTRHRKELPEVAAIGQEAARRALSKIGQHKINSGKFDLLVENRVGSQLLGSLIGPMRGEALQQRSSFLEGMSGQKIASHLFTMIDDPLILGGLGSCRFDGEGMAAKRRIMVEKGVLKSYYIDNYYGRKLKMDPTTGGPTNLVFEYGPHSRDEILKGIKQGILGNGFIGGNSNSTTGDFSFGIAGQYIENGALVKPVNEMNISGNLKDFLKHLAAVGNDPFPYGAWRVSTLHFEGVQFSGV